MGFWEWVGDAIFGTFINALQHIIVKLEKLGMTANTDPNSPINKDVASHVDARKGDIDQLIQTEIQGQLERHSPITPEEGVTLFENISNAIFAGTLAQDVMDIVIDLASLGIESKALAGLKDTLIKKLGGESPITDLLGMKINTSARIPYQYYLNSIYKPVIPPINFIQMALGRGIIDNVGFDNVITYHGFRADYSDWIRHFSFRPLSPRQLQNMSTNGMFDENLMRAELQKMQLEKTTIDGMITLYKKMAMADEIKLEKQLRTKQYTGGSITQGQFRDYLISTGLNQDLANLTIQIEDQNKINSAKDLSLSVQEKLYINGKIDVNIFRARLLNMNYTSGAVEDEISLADLKKQTDPKNLTLTQLEDALNYSQINEQNYYSRMQKLGYLTDDATIILNTYRLKHTKAPKELHKNLTETQIMKFLSQSLISVEDATSRISAMGYDQIDTDLIMQSEMITLSKAG